MENMIDTKINNFKIRFAKEKDTKLIFSGKLAVERDCGRLEWWCIDWNELFVNFYKAMGAKPMDEWTVYRVDDSALNNLANEF